MKQITKEHIGKTFFLQGLYLKEASKVILLAISSNKKEAKVYYTEENTELETYMVLLTDLFCTKEEAEQHAKESFRKRVDELKKQNPIKLLFDDWSENLWEHYHDIGMHEAEITIMKQAIFELHGIEIKEKEEVKEEEIFLSDEDMKDILNDIHS